MITGTTFLEHFDTFLFINTILLLCIVENKRPQESISNITLKPAKITFKKSLASLDRLPSFSVATCKTSIYSLTSHKTITSTGIGSLHFRCREQS